MIWYGLTEGNGVDGIMGNTGFFITCGSYLVKHGGRAIFPALLIWLCADGLVADPLPSFPGAEGFGATTGGGRGGQVLFVTNLNDSGPGSLRAAIEANGPRIVIFRVGGLITLQSPLLISNPYITIAGQTAPGDGICLRGYELKVIGTHDVIIRHLRLRPGDLSGAVTANWGGDCLTMDAIRDVVIDHCSMTWNIDETVEIYKGDPIYPSCDNITVQWCLFAEPLNDSFHEEGKHGYGPLIRTDGAGVTFHHNFFACCDSRNPRVGSKDGLVTRFDFRNNLIYNWADVSGGGGGRDEFVDMNYVGNWLLKGPSTFDNEDIAFETQIDPVTRPEYAINHRIYQSGNIINGLDTGWAMFKNALTRMDAPFDFPAVRTDSAETAHLRVLDEVGATLPRRDSVDQRILNYVGTNGGDIIDSQDEVGGWPDYESGAAPGDSDQDGMPDAWEDAHKLKSDSVEDQNEDPDGDGYLNIEEYINNTDPGVNDTMQKRVADGHWINYQ